MTIPPKTRLLPLAHSTSLLFQKSSLQIKLRRCCIARISCLRIVVNPMAGSLQLPYGFSEIRGCRDSETSLWSFDWNVRNTLPSFRGPKTYLASSCFVLFVLEHVWMFFLELESSIWFNSSCLKCSWFLMITLSEIEIYIIYIIEDWSKIHLWTSLILWRRTYMHCLSPTFFCAQAPKTMRGQPS